MTSPARTLPGTADAPVEELVTRARGGDRWARGVLYRRFAEVLAAYLVRLVGDRDDALDVLHDAFVYAFERLDELREATRFRAWLYRIATNAARSKLRKKRWLRAIGFVQPTEAMSWESMSLDASPEAKAELARLDAMVKRLPVDERIVWVLRRVEGCTMPEVASYAECLVATAKRRMARAEKRMKRMMGES